MSVLRRWQVARFCNGVSNSFGWTCPTVVTFDERSLWFSPYIPRSLYESISFSVRLTWLLGRSDSCPLSFGSLNGSWPWRISASRHNATSRRLTLEVHEQMDICPRHNVRQINLPWRKHENWTVHSTSLFPHDHKRRYLHSHYTLSHDATLLSRCPESRCPYITVTWQRCCDRTHFAIHSPKCVVANFRENQMKVGSAYNRFNCRYQVGD
jgi:hypothetical protein